MINYYLRLWCLFLDVTFHLDSKGMRESIPRQVDKKSGVPKEKKGVWGSQSRGRGLEFSRSRKGQISLFFSTFLSLSHIKHFFL